MADAQIENGKVHGSPADIDERVLSEAVELQRRSRNMAEYLKNYDLGSLGAARNRFEQVSDTLGKIVSILEEKQAHGE